MKKIILLAFAVAFQFSCSSDDDDNNSLTCENKQELVGKWVADRIVGDEPDDEDMATLYYEADGTGLVREESQVLDILWDCEGNSISTTIPEFDFTVESEFELSSTGNILTSITDMGDHTIQEWYYRFTENHPDEFIGNWTPIEQTLDGETVEIDRPELNLEDEGTGTHRWGVTEDRLLKLDIDTLVGKAWEYEFLEEDGEQHLIITEENDFGVTVVTYVQG